MKKLLMSMALVASLAALTACGNPDTGKDPGGNTDDPGGNETPVVTVFAPAAAVSAEKGMTVTLSNYLVSEDTGYSVSFWYTFEGYGEMGATGAQPLEITQKTDADNSFAVNACGEYTIYFVAEKDGKTISEENAAFKLNASDPTQPVLNVSDVALDVSSISAADFTEKYVSVADDYYKELSVRVLQGGENKDTLTFQEGENEVTVEAEDGFGNRVQETVTVTVRTAIVEDPSVLDTVGGIIHHDFDEYASFGEFESSALPESIVGTDNAIEGNSLSLTFEAGGTNVSFFKNDKLSLGAGTYRISFRYKLLTESAPTYFCVGFVGSTQNNRENWFSGRSDEVGQVYEFSNDYKLEADEYYIQLFNLNKCDAKIVIDDFAIENVTQIDVSEILSEAGGKAVHDFDRNTMFGTFESSAMPESVVGTDNAIEGNSLSLTFKAGGTNISFFKNEMLSLGAGTYRISFRYKLLTETKPDYFCVGFNGSAQKNRENWFADRTDQANEIYEFTYDYDLAAGEYYIQLFNLNKCDAKIVIDDFTIENVTQIDVSEILSEAGGKAVHDFDRNTMFGTFESSAMPESVVGTDNAIEGNSLSLTFEAGGTNISFFKNEMLSLGAGTYRISFRYKLLTETKPDYFCVGFNGSAQKNRENWFADRTDQVNEVYEFTHDYDLTAGEYYIQLFNLNKCDAKIVIDDIKIERVA